MAGQLVDPIRRPRRWHRLAPTSVGRHSAVLVGRRAHGCCVGTKTVVTCHMRGRIRLVRLSPFPYSAQGPRVNHARKFSAQRRTFVLTLRPPRNFTPSCPTTASSTTTASPPSPASSFSFSAFLSRCPPTRLFLSLILSFRPSPFPPPPAVSSTLICRFCRDEWCSLRQAWSSEDEGSSRKAMPRDFGTSAVALAPGLGLVVRSRTEGMWPN